MLWVTLLILYVFICDCPRWTFLKFAACPNELQYTHFCFLTEFGQWPDMAWFGYNYHLGGVVVVFACVNTPISFSSYWPQSKFVDEFGFHCGLQQIPFENLLLLKDLANCDQLRSNKSTHTKTNFSHDTRHILSTPFSRRNRYIKYILYIVCVEGSSNNNLPKKQEWTWNQIKPRDER